MQYTEDSPIERDYLVNLLRENLCVVTFVKLDGEVREMPCTLKPDVVPAAVVTEGKEPKEKKQNDAILSVWCTDKDSWRSFRVDRVTAVTVA